jgi:hypothetical protein
MRKLTLMAVAILLSAVSVFAAHSTATVADTTKTKVVKPAAKPKKVQYTCVMHSDVIADKPGKCPKCGMTLVKKEPAKKKAETMKM